MDFQVILQVDLRWSLTLICDLWPHEHMNVSTLYQETKFGSNQTSTFQMRQFSHFQPILQLDHRWPLTLIYDLWPHQQMRVPMLHLWPMQLWLKSIKACGRQSQMVTLFHNRQQQKTTSTDNDRQHQQTDNGGQSDPYVFFLLRQATQKKEENSLEMGDNAKYVLKIKCLILTPQNIKKEETAEKRRFHSPENFLPQHKCKEKPVYSLLLSASLAASICASWTLQRMRKCLISLLNFNHEVKKNNPILMVDSSSKVGQLGIPLFFFFFLFSEC